MHARSGEFGTLLNDDFGTLRDYGTDDAIRGATEREQTDSRKASRHDGGAGVIEVDGVSCYVED